MEMPTSLPSDPSLPSGHGIAPAGEPVLVISCDTCVMRDSDACGDCMMSVLCEPADQGAVVLSLDELREIRLLASAGLVPTLRHRAVS